MATVRIYKVAELLNTSSQEVIALLKRDHGIEVKSASSTIEEVVGRQFVERLARQRNIALPGGDIFADTPAPKGKKPAPAKKAAEPPKPVAAVLPPPRLVKTVKAAPAAVPLPEPADVAEPVVEEPAAEAPAEVLLEPAPVEASAEVAPPPAEEIAPVADPEGVIVEPAAPKPATPGRVVPPTLRLRIEEQRPTTPTPPLPTQAPPRGAVRPAPARP